MNKLFILLSLFLVSVLNAQVGINTNDPRGVIEVNGDVIANEFIFPKNLEKVTQVTKDLYYLLVQNQDENKNIKLLDIKDSKSPGIAALVTFRFEDPNGDWIESFNTNIDATEYALVVLSGYYSNDVGSGNNNALPGIGAYIYDNKWFINADYPSLNDKGGGAKRAWTIQCSIYHKNFVKIFPQQNIDMSNLGTKTASSALLK